MVSSSVNKVALSRASVFPSRLTSTVRFTISKVAVAVTAPKASRVSSPPMRVKSPAKASPTNSTGVPPTSMLTVSATKVWLAGVRSMESFQSSAVGVLGRVPEALFRST